MTPRNLTRRAQPEDLASIRQLLYLGSAVYYYPGWEAPEHWVPNANVWVLTRGSRVDAALAITHEVPGVAWLRLFAVRSGVAVARAWELLWARAAAVFPERRVQGVYALGLDSWIEAHLRQQGWHPTLTLRQLLWEGRAMPPLPSRRADLNIRVARPADLPDLARVNERAFARPWQIGKRVLPRVLQSALLTLVAEHQGRIVGYIMAMATSRGAHIPSFAVLPELQGQGIGRMLLGVMLHRLWVLGYPWVTLNTQEDNHAALHLYRSFGFRDTGQRVRVWMKPWEPQEAPVMTEPMANAVMPGF